jgi:hypothetical protein
MHGMFLSTVLCRENEEKLWVVKHHWDSTMSALVCLLLAVDDDGDDHEEQW